MIILIDWLIEQL